VVAVETAPFWDSDLSETRERVQALWPKADAALAEELKQHPLHRKMLKYPAYEEWYKYHSEVVEGIPSEVSLSDLKKVEGDLSEALTKMHGDYKGIPYKVLAEFLMQSIYEVSDPSKEQGWKSRFSEKIEKYIKEKGLDHGILGIEENVCVYSTVKGLQMALPKAKFKAADDIFATVRLIKDSEEIGLIKEAVIIAEAGLRAGMDAARVGVIEYEVQKASEIAMRQKMPLLGPIGGY
jgi:Xaa-Pro aminopeptidase